MTSSPLAMRPFSSDVLTPQPVTLIMKAATGVAVSGTPAVDNGIVPVLLRSRVPGFGDIPHPRPVRDSSLRPSLAW